MHVCNSETSKVFLTRALIQKPEHLSILSGSGDSEGSASGSPSFSQSSQQKLLATDVKDGRRKSVSRKGDDPSIVDSFPERTQAGDLFCSATRGRRPPPVRVLFGHHHSQSSNISILHAVQILT